MQPRAAASDHRCPQCPCLPAPSLVRCSVSCGAVYRRGPRNGTAVWGEWGLIACDRGDDRLRVVVHRRPPSLAVANAVRSHGATTRTPTFVGSGGRCTSPCQPRKSPSQARPGERQLKGGIWAGILAMCRVGQSLGCGGPTLWRSSFPRRRLGTEQRTRASAAEQRPAGIVSKQRVCGSDAEFPNFVSECVQVISQGAPVGDWTWRRWLATRWRQLKPIASGPDGSTAHTQAPQSVRHTILHTRLAMTAADGAAGRSGQAGLPSSLGAGGSWHNQMLSGPRVAGEILRRKAWLLVAACRLISVTSVEMVLSWRWTRTSVMRFL